MFGELVLALNEELDQSEVFSHDTAISVAWYTMESLVWQMSVLENET